MILALADQMRLLLFQIQYWTTGGKNLLILCYKQPTGKYRETFLTKSSTEVKNNSLVMIHIL